MKGQVLDKNTGHPISDVAICNTDNSWFTMTDENGYFIIESNKNNPVHLIHLAYDPVTIWPDSFNLHSTFFLNPHDIELSEAVVTPYHAEKILDQAIKNLGNKLEMAQSKTYLCHIDESLTFQGSKEIYALIDISLEKMKSNGDLDWDFNVVQLDKIKDDLSAKKDRLINHGLILENMSVNKKLDLFDYELKGDSDDRFVISISPKKTNKKRYLYFLFYINKQDTILTEAIAQSYPNSSELTTIKYRDIKWQKNNHFFKIQFSKGHSGKYYMESYLNDAKINIKAPEGEYVQNHKNTIKLFTGTYIVDNDIEKRLKKTYTFSLFELENMGTPDFWKNNNF